MALEARSELDEFKERHSGQDIVVFGLGPSASTLAPFMAEELTVGVNDIGRHFSPTYLVLQDFPSAFLKERLRFIEETDSDCAFVAFEFPNLRSRKTVRVRLGEREGSEFGANEKFSYAGTSVYLATCVAAFLGAKRIALAGVDFLGPGRTYSNFFVQGINQCFARLCFALKQEGRELYNLAEHSKLRTVPHINPFLFLDRR